MCPVGSKGMEFAKLVCEVDILLKYIICWKSRTTGTEE